MWYRIDKFTRDRAKLADFWSLITRWYFLQCVTPRRYFIHNLQKQIIFHFKRIFTPDSGKAEYIFPRKVYLSEADLYSKWIDDLIYFSLSQKEFKGRWKKMWALWSRGNWNVLWETGNTIQLGEMFLRRCILLSTSIFAASYWRK